MQWPSTKFIGIHHSRRKGGKANAKTSKNCDRSRGKKSLIGKDCPVMLSFKVAESNKNSDYHKNLINNINSKTNKTEILPELKRTENKFITIFKRHGIIVGHTNKIEFKEVAKVRQQKGRRVPLQLRKAMD